MNLIIDSCWIRHSDNPWIPIEIFRGGDQYIFCYRFKKCIILYDITGSLLPLFEPFGGFESSYIGGRVVKILLNHHNIKVKE
jgi:hypothetical protein